MISEQLLAAEIVALLERGAEVTLQVRGKSMSPTLASGTSVKVVPWRPPAQLLPGEVVLIQQPSGTLVIHRLYRLFPLGETGEPTVQTWGDGSHYPDQPVSLSCVIGRVKDMADRAWWVRFRQWPFKIRLKLS